MKDDTGVGTTGGGVLLFPENPAQVAHTVQAQPVPSPGMPSPIPGGGGAVNGGGSAVMAVPKD